MTLVFNAPYRLGRLIGLGTRPRLDGGELGVAVIGARDEAGALITGIREWTADSLDVGSSQSLAAGIDGGAVPQHPGASPSARLPKDAWDGICELARIAALGSDGGTSWR